MSLAYVIVDVFTDTPLQGNQLAVFEDGSALSDDQMQRFAQEMNLSETAFLFPAEDGGDARMRIFTPAAELAFAGHSVLGAAQRHNALQPRFPWRLLRDHVHRSAGRGPEPMTQDRSANEPSCKVPALIGGEP